MKQKLTQFFGFSLLLFVLLLKGTTVLAQVATIKGKVTSANGVALSVTDANGYYAISTSQPDATLVINYVGYTSREVKTDGKTQLDITLLELPKDLDEVVVTAMGIKKEAKRIGYAVTEINGADLTKTRDANPINSLVGKVAGLNVGGSAEMLGRPQLVLRGSTDLLFVVDGVPINSDTWNISPDDIDTYTILKGTNAAALYGFRGINGAIVITTKRGTKDKKGWQVDFNSNTMFEKGFLTEPQSQTEYGRGTNYQYSYGDRLYDNAQRLQEYGPRFEGQAIKQYDSPWDPNAVNGGGTLGVRTATPWLARGADNFHKFMETGLLSTNSIAFSTGDNNYDIRMSYAHTYQKGMAPNTSLHYDNFNINAGYNFDEKLRLEGNLNFNAQYSPNIPDQSYGPNSYVYMFKVYGSADYDINDLKDIYKGPSGVNNLVQYAPEYGRENSAWFIAKEWLRTHDKTDIYGYLKLSYKVTKDLSLSARSQVTTWNQIRTEKVPPSTNLNTYAPWYYFGWYGDYREDRRNLIENNSDVLANYNKKISSDWSLSALAGAGFRSFKYNSFYGTTKGLAIPKLYALSNSLTPGLEYTYGARMQVYSGYYSFDISYKKFFTVSSTGRVDNLSTLPSGNNTFFYPSASISSVLTDYINLPKSVSFLKLRASYADVKGGLTNPTIPSAYTAITGINTGTLLGYGTDLYSSFDGPSYTNQNVYTSASYYNGSPSVNFSNTIANPSIKPYDRKSYELGMDLRLLKNRINLDVTYFNSTNGPLIYALPVDPATGYYSQNVNGITSLKKGWEIALNVSPFKNPKGFSWDVNMNWSTFKETLKAIYGNESTLLLNGHNYKVGERLDAFYSTKFVRDQSGNIIYGYDQLKKAGTGAPLSAPTDADNHGFIGNLNPDFSFGINNTLSYKNFSLSFQFDGRIGGKIYDRVLYQGNNGGTSIESASGDFGVARRADWELAKGNASTVAGILTYSIPKTVNGQAYTGAYTGKGYIITAGTPNFSGGQITNFKDLTLAPNTTSTTVQSYLSSGIGAAFDEYYMISRSFAKLREVNLTYRFPMGSVKNKFFKAISVSLIGRNLLYFAARKDFDIEQYASGFNLTDRSVQGTSSTDLQSSTARRFGFNVNFSF
ncbi:TonB-dependent receptor plug [Russula earlei]|uniref:TonB-dependent receptor plug n=1 Tax=Russula earlei TaxID=71964 RepID=A0ACC0TVL2_9AGAM|nr:TonB-dependent receptor plug [Russula earlei]